MEIIYQLKFSAKYWGLEKMGKGHIMSGEMQGTGGLK